MKPRMLHAFLATVVATGLCSLAFATDPPVSKVAFRAMTRQLWIEHATDMCQLMSSTVANSPERTDAIQRLSDVRSGLSDAVRPYYGDAAADQLSILLEGHATAAAEIVSAVLGKDKHALADANRHWYGNADQLADLLSSLNPKLWRKREMRATFHEYVNLNAQEVVAMLNDDAPNTVKFYGRLQKSTLDIADLIARGVEGQFPTRFRSR